MPQFVGRDLDTRLAARRAPVSRSRRYHLDQRDLTPTHSYRAPSAPPERLARFRISLSLARRSVGPHFIWQVLRRGGEVEPSAHVLRELVREPAQQHVEVVLEAPEGMLRLGLEYPRRGDVGQADPCTAMRSGDTLRLVPEAGLVEIVSTEGR